MVRSDRRAEQSERAPRPRRRSNPQWKATAQASWADVSISDTANLASEGTVKVEDKAGLQSVSILKEIFPDHLSLKHAETAAGKGPALDPLETLLGKLPPSPARTRPNGFSGFTQPATSGGFATVPGNGGPPPSQWLPSQDQASKDPWDATATPAAPDTAIASYRERLRAGGRGAFQRSVSGFVAKMTPPVAQDQWLQDWSTPGQGYFTPQQDMQYTTDASQMPWPCGEQMQSSDGWNMPMNQPQMLAEYEFQQQMVPASAEMMQMDMASQQQQYMLQPQMMPQMVQQPQMMPQSEQLLQMQMPQVQVPQMQLPQMAMSQVPTVTASGDSTPDEMGRCMAIVMPQSAPYAQDKDFVAAQLQAVADCQCYED